MLKLQVVSEHFASVAGGDYWAETGETGRWVRVHTQEPQASHHARCQEDQVVRHD